jgi:Skp family chaperone for outer membrane proteins
MKRSLFLIIIISIFFIPSFLFPITLVRVGYIDLDLIIATYTTKYLETEIAVRNEYINSLQLQYSTGYLNLTEGERYFLQLQIDDQREVLDMLHYNLFLWENSEELKDDIVYHILQRDIMEAIQKTSELEGFSLILDNTGNFIYGSEDVNLTDKVLFRLDEKLLDIQDSDPKAPLSLELEDEEAFDVPLDSPLTTDNNN